LKYILKVEVQLEIGAFSLRVEVEVEVWRGPQAAPNTLGPSYLVE
jgi:hypothetical protein